MMKRILIALGVMLGFVVFVLTPIVFLENLDVISKVVFSLCGITYGYTVYNLMLNKH